MENVGHIQDHRNHIDAIDERILRWVNQRIQVGLEIGKIKEYAGVEITDSQRERDVLRRLKVINNGPLSDDAILRIFRTIIEETRKVQLAQEAQHAAAAHGAQPAAS